MNIIKNRFETKISGKCVTEYDVLILYKFGYSIDGIAKKYAKDNKIKKKEADRLITDMIYQYLMKGRANEKM